MDFLSDTVVLSRMQFALTACIHMLWPTLTTGVGIYLVIIEGLWLKTKNPDYYYHARFWAKLYALNFGVGVATGMDNSHFCADVHRAGISSFPLHHSPRNHYLRSRRRS